MLDTRKRILFLASSIQHLASFHLTAPANKPAAPLKLAGRRVSDGSRQGPFFREPAEHMENG
jgi:hypothetical protein